MVAHTMLDHQKIILENVIDDKELFQKELKKSISWLEPEDVKKLYLWLKTNFWNSHKDMLLSISKKVAAL